MDDQALSALIRKAVAGDMDATEALIRGLHAHLFSFLYMTGVSENDIEDVGQKVVLAMYRALPTYETDKPFLPWFRGIARHVTIDHWRTEAREKQRRSLFREQVVLEAENRLRGGKKVFLAQEHLRGCVGRLSDRNRQMLELRYFKDCTCEQVAEVLKMSVVAVRQALVRVRQALRRCVETTKVSPASGDTA